jgi:hypothetical protein
MLADRDGDDETGSDATDCGPDAAMLWGGSAQPRRSVPSVRCAA